MPKADDRPRPKADAKDAQAPRLLEAQQLFRGEREIWIEHAGTRYRLRITRRNRLILQK
jgi:hemin uptake protein HemP